MLRTSNAFSLPVSWNPGSTDSLIALGFIAVLTTVLALVLSTRGKEQHSKVLLLWAIPHLLLWFIILESPIATLALAGWELTSLLQRKMKSVFFANAPLSKRSLWTQAAFSVVTISLLAFNAPLLDWSTLHRSLSRPDALTNPANLALLLWTLSLLWRSGVLTLHAGTGKSASYQLFEICTLRVPALVLAWHLFSTLAFPFSEETLRWAVHYGILFFTVHQWIAFSRNNLLDFLSCQQSAVTGLLWSALFFCSFSLAHADALAAYSWGIQIAVVGGFVLGYWLEQTVDLPKERNLRGMLDDTPALAIPAAVFFLSLAGQPWLLGSGLLAESLQLVGTFGAATLFTFLAGTTLLSGKTLQLSLSLFFPTSTASGLVKAPARIQATLWLIAASVVAMGLYPAYLRNIF